MARQQDGKGILEKTLGSALAGKAPAAAAGAAGAAGGAGGAGGMLGGLGGLGGLAGSPMGAIIPMATSLNLMNDKSFRSLGLSSTVMKVPELIGNASFGISPRHPELKESVDNALDRIKRNGVYERINSQFLPFRIQ